MHPRDYIPGEVSIFLKFSCNPRQSVPKMYLETYEMSTHKI